MHLRAGSDAFTGGDLIIDLPERQMHADGQLGERAAMPRQRFAFAARLGLQISAGLAEIHAIELGHRASWFLDFPPRRKQVIDRFYAVAGDEMGTAMPEERSPFRRRGYDLPSGNFFCRRADKCL